MPNTYCQDVSILTLFSEVTQTTTDFDFSPVKNKFALITLEKLRPSTQDYFYSRFSIQSVLR